MSDTASTYDALPYNDRAFVTACPDRLAVVGMLHGLAPAPVERCRVLELGCGPGGNLIPMAAALPEGRFLGIDLSARQVEQGRGLVERLGLRNVELRRQDLMDFGEGAGRDEGEFDYILCHGVYSWVPPAVQERVLHICWRHLADRGLAMVSYNVYPGWHVQGAVRDILRHGARGAGPPAEQVRQAMEFLGFVGRSVFDPDGAYGRAIRTAAEALAAESSTYVFHEHLESCNAPVHFEEFAARAAAAGLKYVGDAGLHDPSALLTAEARQALGPIEDDAIRCEQLLDFLRNRAFRTDVLCRDGLSVQRWPQPDALKAMLLVAAAEPVSQRPRTADDTVEQFRNAKGHTLSTGDAALKTALVALHEARPCGLAWAELLAKVRAGAPQADERALARSLLACALASLADLHAHLPPIASRPGQRPVATAAARWQAAEGRLIVNLRHRTVELDELSRAVLARLNGTRDRTALADEVDGLLRKGDLRLAGRPDGAPSLARDELGKAVAEVLDALAGLCLLEK